MSRRLCLVPDVKLRVLIIIDDLLPVCAPLSARGPIRYRAGLDRY